MKANGIFNWFGLTLWLLSALCLSMIGLRRSPWFGKQRSFFSKWESFDITLAKTSGLLFITGIILFILGSML